MSGNDIEVRTCSRCITGTTCCCCDQQSSHAGLTADFIEHQLCAEHADSPEWWATKVILWRDPNWAGES